MIIKNVLVYTEDKYFKEGTIYIENGVFVENASDDEVIDGQGCYAIPGLVDVHFHGCMGADFCDGTPEAIATIAEYEASQGVTTIVPATMTLSEEELMKIMSNAGAYKNEKGATLAGINMEGPFISVAKKGAQAATHIRKPDVEMFRKLDKNGVVLTIMAMAIVFGALLVLSICFYVISKVGEKVSKINKSKSHGVEPKTIANTDLPTGDSGEEIAAIVMALHEHLNAHDQESTILTINKVKRAYSPWSSKIYGLRELPRK